MSGGEDAHAVLPKKERGSFSAAPAIADHLTRWVGGVTAWSLAVIVLAISAASLFVTYVFGVGFTVAFRDASAWRPLIISAGITLLNIAFFLAVWLWVRHCRLSTVITIALLFATAVSALYTSIFATNATTYPDINVLSNLAASLIDGRLDVFLNASNVTEVISGNASTYLIRVPYQAGSLLLFAGVYKLFGAMNLVALQALNVVANVLSIAMLIGVSAEMTREVESELRRRVVGMTAIISCTFFPFLFSASFAYTNSIGLCFVMAAFWVSSHAWSNPDKTRAYTLSMLCSVLLFCIGIMVKTTFMLLSFALCAAWALDCLKTRRSWLLACIPTALLLCLKASSVPVLVLQWLTGREFGEGQPFLMNIAMGLSWSDQSGRPGWWGSTSFECYNQNNGDMAAQSAWCREIISQRIRTWIDDPRDALRFFSIKLTTEWLEPSYMTLWFSECAAQPQTPIMELAIHGSASNRLLVMVLDGMQTGLYFLSSIGLIETARIAWRRTCDTASLLLVGSIFSGCLCYVFWEAQSIYTLPFAFMMIPFCAMGICRIRDALEKRYLPSINRRL